MDPPTNVTSTLPEPLTFAFHVADTFQIEGRGVVLMGDTSTTDIDSRFRFQAGDRIELRQAGHTLLRSHFAGHEFVTPSRPDRPFAFLLPPDVTKRDVPIGAEVWVPTASLSPRTGPSAPPTSA